MFITRSFVCLFAFVLRLETISAVDDENQVCPTWYVFNIVEGKNTGLEMEVM